MPHADIIGVQKTWDKHRFFIVCNCVQRVPFSIAEDHSESNGEKELQTVNTIHFMYPWTIYIVSGIF